MLQHTIDGKTYFSEDVTFMIIKQLDIIDILSLSKTCKKSMSI